MIIDNNNIINRIYNFLRVSILIHYAIMMYKLNQNYFNYKINFTVHTDWLTTGSSSFKSSRVAGLMSKISNFFIY